MKPIRHQKILLILLKDLIELLIQLHNLLIYLPLHIPNLLRRVLLLIARSSSHRAAAAEARGHHPTHALAVGLGASRR